MNKKITKTIVNEYNSDGKLIKSTETIIEETQDYSPIPYIPINPYPWQPTITYKSPSTSEYKVTCENVDLNSIADSVSNTIYSKFQNSGVLQTQRR